MTTRLRLALRLARRDVVRRPGRTLLVMLLVAVPIAGMTAAATLVRSEAQTPAEAWAESNGSADAVAHFGGEDSEVIDAKRAAIDKALPPGARTVTEVETYVSAVSDAGRAGFPLHRVDIADPIEGGRFDVVEGRAPQRGFEIALSEDAADRLEVGVGDSIMLRGLDESLPVVGVVEHETCLGCTLAFAAAPGATAIPFTPFDSQRVKMQFSEPLSDSQLLRLGEITAAGGIQFRDISVTVPDPNSADQGVRWIVVLGAVCLAVVGIVISAAFSVSARRQLQTIGQLGANGADPFVQRSTLALQGTTTGLLGVLAGFALAAVGLLATKGLIERNVFNRRISGFDIRPDDVLLIALVGMSAATIAALVPAWSVSRVPILSALAGRRPLGRVRPALTVAGVVGMALGLGLLGMATVGSSSGSDGDLWAFVAILGGLGVLFGACALTPRLISGIEPLATRARGVTRMAARSLTRQRTRSGAVVAAVAAAGALAVASAALIQSNDTGSVEFGQLADEVAVVQTSGAQSAYAVPADKAFADRVAAILPDATRFDTAVTQEAISFPLSMASTGEFFCCLYDSGLGVLTPDQEALDPAFRSRALVVDADLAKTLQLPTDVRARLDETGIVAVTPVVLDPSEIEVTMPDGSTVATMLMTSKRDPAGAGILVSEQAVTEFDLAIEGGPVVFDNGAPITDVQRFGFEDLSYVGGFGTAPIDTATEFSYVNVNYSSSGPSLITVQLVLSGLAVAFALLVVTIGLALSAAETRDERDILTVIGAPPGTLARVSGSKAWLLALLGFGLAVPVGFLPVVVFVAADDTQTPLVFPTSLVATLVLLVPVVVGVVAWLGSTVVQRFRPVTVSRLAFE